jgi:hypothetical protein
MAASISRKIHDVLPNFRLVFPRKPLNDDPNVIKGVLFRTSRPDFLDEENADMIYKSGIKTIIDCRDVKEYQKLRADKFLDKRYALYYPPEPIPKFKLRYKVNEPVKLKKVASQKHQVQSNSHFRHICLEFFKMNYILQVLCQAPLLMVVKSMFYLLKDLFNFGSKYYKNFVRYFADNFINPAGLANQYKNMVDWSQASICAGELFSVV